MRGVALRRSDQSLSCPWCRLLLPSQHHCIAQYRYPAQTCPSSFLSWCRLPECHPLLSLCPPRSPEAPLTFLVLGWWFGGDPVGSPLTRTMDDNYRSTGKVVTMITTTNKDMEWPIRS